MMKTIMEVIQSEIKQLLSEKDRLIIAIDGRCASGKTTLAAQLNELFKCNVIHMDHFFLRPEQRTAERFLEPGGNVDYERFLKEVMLPLKKQEHFCYHPYDCKAGKLSEAIYITPKRINIIEGSYSCHPALVSNYDLKVFITVDKEEQMRRITIRNGEIYADVFRKKWIPMEEGYFSAYQIKEQCDICWKS